METALLPCCSRQVIIPQTPAVPRAGEGTSVLLNNGQILLIYSRFIGGGADHDTAELFGGILDPITGEIRDGRVFFEDKDAMNQMNPSLARMRDGSLGIIYLRRTGTDENDILFSRSSDEGVTWSSPIPINRGITEKFIVINCDRLRCLSTGRLVAPACLYPDHHDPSKPASLGVFYSDDGGETWARSERIKTLEKNIHPPHRLNPAHQQQWDDGRNYFGREQEPGIEELADGRVYLWCRTTMGYMYQAYSSDGGVTWGELKAATDIVSPCSPQSIRRIPGSKRLVCIFNDRRSVSFADADNNWRWRTPLTLAVSDDDAASWQILGNIEDYSHNYCYTSMLFFDQKLLLTYYESENLVKEGVPTRRDLANLKMQILALETVS